MTQLPPTWNPAVNVAETVAHSVLFVRQLSELLEPVGLVLQVQFLDAAAAPEVEGEKPQGLVFVSLKSAISDFEIWRGHAPVTWFVAFFPRSVSGEIGFPRLALMAWHTGAGRSLDDPQEESFAEDWASLREQLALGCQRLLEESLLELAKIMPVHRYGLSERVEAFRMMCRAVLATGQEKKL